MARVDLGSRKLLIMSNAATSACAVTRMAAADWKRIDEFARRLVKDAVECCGCSPEEYFSLAGEIELTKTHGRCAVGNMTTIAHALWADDIDMAEELQWRQMEELVHHSYRVTLRTMLRLSRGALHGRPRRSFGTAVLRPAGVSRILGNGVGAEEF